VTTVFPTDARVLGPAQADDPAPRRPDRWRPKDWHVTAHVILIVLAAVAIGPMLVMVFNAFKSNAQIGANPLTPPTSLSLHNFTQAWHDGNYATTMRNSILLVGGSVLGTCTIASLAAYALSHLKVPGGGGVIAYLILASTMPVQLFLVPLFSMWTHLGLVDSRLGLLIIYWATEAPFATLLLRSFLIKVPRDFVEAARIDGASELTIVRRVIVPLAWPGVMTVGLIVALTTWNEFFWAMTFIHDPGKRPISISFLSFQDQYSTNWGLTSAAALFVMVPILLLFTIMQRHFVAGLTSGGLK
jgi:raffinose/stachyose/melibiose transport system permease protein